MESTVQLRIDNRKLVKDYYTLKMKWQDESYSFADRIALAEYIHEHAGARGLYPYRRILHSEEDREGWQDSQGNYYKVNLGSNDYLNYSKHPQVIQSGIDMMRKHGVGSGSVPMFTGTQHVHRQLEESLAQFLGFESCLLYNSGYAANIGVLGALIGQHDAVVMDTLVHASLLDGCTAGHRYFFLHNDLESLRRSLEKAQRHRNVLIVTEGVYSMDGDLGKLDSIVEIAEEWGASVLVDDAHGIGVMGPCGRGTTAHFGVENSVDILTGSFGKALAGVGGFVCGSKACIQYLEMMSRPFQFSSSIPPGIAASILREIELLERGEPALEQLWRNMTHLAQGLDSMGYDISCTQSPIIPILIKDELEVMQLCADLAEEKIYVNPIIYPVVSKNKSRLRLSVTAALNDDDVAFTLDVFKKLAA